MVQTIIHIGKNSRYQTDMRTTCGTGLFTFTSRLSAGCQGPAGCFFCMENIRGHCDGTREQRFITSFICTDGIQPKENWTPRGISGMCGAFSALRCFITRRQSWLSWVFMRSTIRCGKSCINDSRCPRFLGYIFWFQSIIGVCDCCDDG